MTVGLSVGIAVAGRLAAVAAVGCHGACLRHTARVQQWDELATHCRRGNE